MFTLPKLQYKYDALEPFIDAETMEIHHTKHHQSYVNKLNKIVEENPSLHDKSLEELCLEPLTKDMAGGHFNHSLFWETIGPKNSGIVPTEIEVLREDFDTKAVGLFGSGWAWIVESDGLFEIITTANQDSPLIQNKKPILGLDLWEHSYYLLYKWNRAEYIKNWWNVVNWLKVVENLSKS